MDFARGALTTHPGGVTCQAVGGNGDGGCGGRVGARTGSPSGTWLLALFAVPLLGRRRRRKGR